MKKTYTYKAVKGMSAVLMVLIIVLSSVFQDVQAQLIRPFTQRTSTFTPTKKIYNIKGDFQMIGNTNLTLQNYGDETPNSNNSMIFVDVDNTRNTLNSSSATLTLSTENGALPECSNIIYAGLYWTGRAHDGASSPDTFTVSKSFTGGEPQSVTTNYTVQHSAGVLIPNTSYTMAVTRLGNNNSYYLHYEITSNVGAPPIWLEFQNISPYVRYSLNSGSTWQNVSNEVITNNGNLRTATFDPIIFYNSSGYLYTVSSLVRDSRMNQTANTYRSTASASGTLTSISTDYTIIKHYDKRKVYLKGPGESSYLPVTANVNDISYPTSTAGMMYSAYAEVTDYVKAHGIGEYSVADIALREGDGGSTGFYGGWGLIVVYENSKMKWRDVTIFDGHAYVRDEAGSDAMTYYQLPVTGFNTAQNGHIRLKYGLMAGEGDRNLGATSIDRFSIRDTTNHAWNNLHHPNNTADNYFNSSVYTGGNVRNPSLLNNTGMDIVMDTIPNVNNAVIKNSQTSTLFRYGTNQDTYIIFCMGLAVDAYVPYMEAKNSILKVDNINYSSGMTVLPGDTVEYTLELRNKGNEQINNGMMQIPIPYAASYVEGSITVAYYDDFTSPPPVFNPNLGANGSIVWSYGVLPLAPPGNPDFLLGKMTFKLRASTDCFVLSNSACVPQVTIDGICSGVGETSGTNFNDVKFIQGYQMEGTCQGEPIYDPVSIVIDRDQFVSTNCQGQDYTTQAFNYCNFTGSIPFVNVTGHFPTGSRYYSAVDTSGPNPVPAVGATEYNVLTGFPNTVGTTTYYVIPPGTVTCSYQFTITVESITSVPVVAPVTYCRGDVAVPLAATPSVPGYVLYYYTSPTDETAETSITPSTATTGTFHYYVAEGKAGQCISTNRADLLVTVDPCACLDLISNRNVIKILK